jgi:hypothetical protein
MHQVVSTAVAYLVPEPELKALAVGQVIFEPPLISQPELWWPVAVAEEDQVLAPAAVRVAVWYPLTEKLAKALAVPVELRFQAASEVAPMDRELAELTGNLESVAPEVLGHCTAAVAAEAVTTAVVAVDRMQIRVVSTPVPAVEDLPTPMNNWFRTSSTYLAFTPVTA